MYLILKVMFKLLMIIFVYLYDLWDLLIVINNIREI